MSSFFIQGQLFKHPISFLVDTGSPVSLLQSAIWNQTRSSDTVLNPWGGNKLVGVNGTSLHIHGLANVTITVLNKTFVCTMVIVDDITVDAILGLDFLEANQCSIDVGERLLHFPSCMCSVPVTDKCDKHIVVNVIMAETRTVPPYSELEVLAVIPDTGLGKLGVIESTQTKTAVMAARTLIDSAAETVPVKLLNPCSEPTTVYKGTKIATLEEVSEIDTSIAAVRPSEQSSQHTKPSSDLSDALWTTVSRSDTDLDPNQQQQLYKLLLQFHDVFATDQHDLGHTTVIQHQIDTGNSPPIRQHARRMPPIHRQEAKQLLQDMLSNGIIQPSSSPWASPIVLVKKKDGTLRFCIDYRKVNAVTRKDAYPLPRVDDALDALASCKWFTTLDLLSGYWQVEVDPSDREKTAFTTYDGLFEFMKMPFGLCNAPATFQRLMDLVLAGLQWHNCLVYLDDILIIGKTFKEHLENLQLVFDRLREAGLKLKPSKCRVCQKEVTYLGHVISPGGITTDSSKTDKVNKWPIPTSQREIRQFLGFVSYYRRFIKNFATIAKPLHRLTEKNAQFKWTSHCQTAFDHLKECLTTAPVLAFPDFNKTFILDTDASDAGIGAVLSQLDDDNKERVIAYASRTLSKPERRYCVTRKELLSVVTFIHHFRPFLLGNKFVLRTDHGSLTWLANFKQPEGQMARWIEKLQEYNFDIIHRPGRKHSNADSLSRLPCHQCGRDSHVSASTVAATTVSDIPVLQHHSTESLRQGQLDDATIGLVLKALELNSKPTATTLQGCSPAVRRLIQLWDQLELHNGLLYRRFVDQITEESHLQLIVPLCYRNEILQELHAGVVGGHLGQDKTLSRLKERFYWPGHWNDVHNWCRTCATCASRKTPSPKMHAQLQPVRTGYPMQLVATDILGPLPLTENGNSYLLVATDYFTRWVEAYPIPNQEAVTVANKLTKEFFFRFSLPDQLHSDQGRQFESTLISEVCKILQIHKSRTTPYHPQGDGLVERFNRTLLDMLSTTIKDHQGSWEDRVQAVCLAYNTSVQPTTGYTPFYLMFGRQARLPIDIMFGNSPVVTSSPSVYATKLQQSLTTAYDQVRNKMDATFQRQKQFYDQKVHGRPFTVGDLVWLYSPVVPTGQAKKLYHPWTGPYEVVKKLSDATYRIVHTQSKRQRLVVHFDRLKLCPPGTRLPLPTQLPSTTQDKLTHVHSPSQPFGTNLQLVDVDDPPSHRYPRRTHNPPDRYSDDRTC